MAEHQTLAPGRRVAVIARDDLAVGAAHTERQRAHEDSAVIKRRLGDVVEPRGIGYAGQDRDGAHGVQQLRFDMHLRNAFVFNALQPI